MSAVEAARRLKALAEKTTPAPWAANRHGAVTGGKLYPFMRSEAPAQVAMATIMEPDNGSQDGNAHFIAAARNDIEMVCDALLASHAQVERMREAMSAVEAARREALAGLQDGMEVAKSIGANGVVVCFSLEQGEALLSLQSQVERMREALESISANGLWNAENPNSLKSIQAMARAALTPKEEK